MADDNGRQHRNSEAYFADQFAAFKKDTQSASRVSQGIGGLFVSERVGWSQWMHLKLCIAADSLIRLASFQDRIQNGEICTLDQSTIASISRGMIEAAAMIAYMTEQSLSDAEWKLRRLVICLHDATTRYKMFKGWKNDTEAAGHRANMLELRAEIQSSDAFKKLPEDRRQKVLSGQEVYLHGLRSAIRLMGWDVDDFDSVYAYVSSHTHSSPVSFIRLAEHGVDFVKPTDAQYDIAGFAIEWARNVLNFATDKIVTLFPDASRIVEKQGAP